MCVMTTWLHALRAYVHPREVFEGIGGLETVLRRRPLAIKSAVDQNGPRFVAHQPEVVVDAQVVSVAERYVAYRKNSCAFRDVLDAYRRAWTS